MTNSKSTKRALVSSALAVMMCVAMLIGTTFAWFTDTASTSVNKIQAGTLDIALEVKENGNWVSAEGKTLDFVKAEGHENEAILWEPGCTYTLPQLRIVNNGNLALKYKVIISGINGDAKLNEVIDWTIGDVAQGEEHKLAAGANNEFTISGTMKKTAGNAYQGLSIDGISITVYATQYTSEYDSNNNTYDQNAQLPSVWDGTVGTVPTVDASGVITITDAAQFAAFAASVNNYNTYSGKTVVLGADIDLNNIAWTPIGMVTPTQNNPYFLGTFDGQGHTVYNLRVDKTDADNELEYTTAGLFGWVDAAGCTIKNLNLDGADVKGNHYTGALAGYFTGTIENCSVVNSTVVSVAHDNDNDGDKVGSLVGYVNANGTVKNSSVSASTVIGKRDVGGLVGCTYNNTCTVTGNTVSDTVVYYNTANGGEVVGRANDCDISANTASNVTVTANATAVSNANDLTSAIEDRSSVVLSGNITTGDNTNYGSNTVGIAVNGGVTLDCNGNTLSNGNSNGFAIITNGATIKNLTLKDSARAIFIDKITSDVVIDNVIINGAGYAINTGDKNNVNARLIVTNSTVNGWTSFANIASANFTNCSFGSSHYYEAEVYQHYLCPYISATFTGCSFDTGFYIDLTKLGAGCTVTLQNCTCNGVKLTNENFADYVKIIKNVVDGADVYAANGDSLTNCIFQ